MTRSVRLTVFFAAAVLLGCVLLWGMDALPPVGEYGGPYGDLINAVAPRERNVTDTVASVNFDYRGLDTMGEELILFTSVMGVALLLRRHPDEEEDKEEEEEVPRTSDAVRLLTLGLVALTVAFGIYIVAHGQLTPGGGFQGGVILATAPLLVYLAGDAEKFLRVAPEHLVEAAEALGIFGFVAVGLVGLFAGRAFLQNVLPLGAPGSVFSSGTIALLNWITGLEVAGGFVLLLLTFLEETLRRRR
jgi:multicomponent Na+:H+ antiporter subunit B